MQYIQEVNDLLPESMSLRHSANFSDVEFRHMWKENGVLMARVFLLSEDAKMSDVIDTPLYRFYNPNDVSVFISNRESFLLYFKPECWAPALWAGTEGNAIRYEEYLGIIEYVGFENRVIKCKIANRLA